MFEIFILAVIAGFVFFRLHAVLGQRTGHEKSSRSPFDMAAESGNHVPTIPAHRAQRVRKKKDAAEAIPQDHPSASELRQLTQSDPTFSLEGFVSGARNAFQVIVQAFAEGKLDILKKLLDKNLYQDFARVIKERKDREESTTIQILGFDEVSVTEARIEKKMAYITVRYDTQQKLSARVSGQEPVETTDNVIDVWTFSKEIRSTNPNWVLVASRTE